LSLTEAGAALYEKSREALAQIDDAELAVGRLQSEPRGVLKLSAPMSFGILHIAPALPEFLHRHPHVMVEMKMDDRIVDLIEEGFDLAIRISALGDSALIARKLAPCRQVVCASPEYLARHDTPQTPEDLASHNCIVYSYAASPNVWRFVASDGSEIAVPVRGNLRVNNGLAERFGPEPYWDRLGERNKA
jgi:DNA-binding transcriptional LysR family regulator